MKLIRGGTVVNANHTARYEVLIAGDKIAALLDPNSDILDSIDNSNCEIIDASDKYVIPGGVDSHVHLQLPMSDQATSSDTFETGTQAAAWGGTTTVIDFAGQIKGTAVPEAIEARMAEADGQCAIDYSFHLSVGDVHKQSLIDIRNTIEAGITSYKLFMAYPDAWYSDDGQILQVMQLAAETGAMTMMHAENVLLLTC